MNRYTHEQAIDLYRRMGERERQLIRRLASQRLVNRGCEEVGTSDINHEISSICNEYDGSFVVFMEDHLTAEELEGWKSLA
jgi:hypothetical protein